MTEPSPCLPPDELIRDHSCPIWMRISTTKRPGGSNVSDQKKKRGKYKHSINKATRVGRVPMSAANTH